MLGADERVLIGNIELVVANIMEEHIDAAEVIGGQVNLLPKEALPDILFTENSCRFEKQRTGTAGGVVDLIDLCFPHDSDTGQKLGDLLRCEELAPRIFLRWRRTCS